MKPEGFMKSEPIKEYLTNAAWLKLFFFFFFCVFGGIIWDSSYNFGSKTACQLFNDHGNYLLQASCKPCSTNMNPKNDALALEMFQLFPTGFERTFLWAIKGYLFLVIWICVSRISSIRVLWKEKSPPSHYHGNLSQCSTLLHLTYHNPDWVDVLVVYPITLIS